MAIHNHKGTEFINFDKSMHFNERYKLDLVYSIQLLQNSIRSRYDSNIKIDKYEKICSNWPIQSMQNSSSKLKACFVREVDNYDFED